MATEDCEYERRERCSAPRVRWLGAAVAVAALLTQLPASRSHAAISLRESALSATAVDAPHATVPHIVLARILPGTFEAEYLAVDAPLRGVQWSTVIRARFQVRNPNRASVALTPRLEFRRAAGGTYRPVPAAGPSLGEPFYLAREWVRTSNPKGRSRPGAGLVAIEPDGFRIDAGEAGGEPVEGLRLAGPGPADPMVLPPRSVTEVEFSLRVTMDAQHRAVYELGLADGDTLLRNAAVARVQMGPRPLPVLSPGQRKGARVVASTSPSGRARAVARHQEAEVEVRYPLAKDAPKKPAASGLQTAAEVTNPHGPFSSTANQCAACHRSHTGKSPNLLPLEGPQSNLCLTCHDGTGAATNVAAQYSDPAVPENNPAAREYFRHDALTASSHTRSDLDEFGGVANRHAECGDCHNAHRVTAAASSETANGWAASGRLDGISGVSVANGAAGTAPAYSVLDGVAQPITLEYQLCLKCHSGFTTLPSNVGFPPSKQVLDKGVEFNPANASYHPVEAPGTNATPKMAENLAGTSPYKLWTFTVGSTIRCTNCHVSGAAYTPGTPPPAGSDLPIHTSPFRSMLLQNYRDRVLKSAGEGYAAADFALCYTCHGEQPFATKTETATNFRLHGLHLTDLAGEGSGGTDIDTPGAGQGNAICAECHFRLHSTAYPVGTQSLSGTRLVNFAPNVRPSGGVLSWTRTPTGGSCTLTCHGENHSNAGYGGG